jgi:hypothetical protein
MTRAEERAQAYENGLDYYHYTGDNPSVAYKAGYEAAEKDLAPLIEAAMIVYEAWNGGTMDDVRRGMDELEKRFKETKK